MGKKTIDDAEIGELLGRIPADSALGSCGDNEQVGEGWMIPIGKRLRALVERMNRAEHAAQADLTVLDDQTLAYLRINMGGRLEAVRPAPPQDFDDWEQVKAALPLKSERVHVPASEVPF